MASSTKINMLGMSKMRKFEYRKTILEHHLDTFGHVNNAVYLQLYEEARWDFITKNGFGLDRIVKDKVGPVVLEAHVTFKRELGNREEILITSQYKEMKNSLVMIIEQEILKSDGSISSQAQFHIAIFDTEKRKLITPPDEWRDAIQ